MENTIVDELKRIRNTVHEIAGGIDEDADINNTSPEDMNAHLGGLIWQALNTVIPQVEQVIRESERHKQDAIAFNEIAEAAHIVLDAANVPKEDEGVFIALDKRIALLVAERDELYAWKESAMSVIPDCQAIARELNVPLGQSVHDKIVSGIKALKSERDDLNHILALQHTRTVEADRAWQVAHNSLNTLPDIGTLIEWLMGRALSAEGKLEDCNWPMCGCDPHADRVIEALQESGFRIQKGVENVVIMNLRRRIHNIERHNQWFERCESSWCHPSPDNDPSLEPSGDFAKLPRCQNSNALKNLFVDVAQTSGLGKLEILEATRCLAEGLQEMIESQSGGKVVEVDYIQEIKPHESLSCHRCGAQMVPEGFKCLSCGASTKPTESIAQQRR